MAKTYKWRASTRFKSTSTLSHGVTPADQDTWQTAGEGTLSGSYTYWYRDANVAGPSGYTNANSSRVKVSVTESWDATIDNSNNLIITIRTTINSIVRDDLRGSNQNTPGREIKIYRVQGGSAVVSVTDNQVATAHTIWSGPKVLDEYTFTLAPGEHLERSSLYLHNKTVGYNSYDDIWFGIQFRNDLPADYVPGATWNGSKWLSHNRTGGTADLYNGSTWNQMRTVSGDGDTTGDPPYIQTGSKWVNQRNIGEDS